MKESDAKKHKCIGGQNLGVLTPPEGKSLNEVAASSCKRLCEGSDCLAWRWHKLLAIEFHPDGNSYKELPKDDREGHCGLAGDIPNDYNIERYY